MKVKIPEAETTYWLAIQKLPDFLKTKHHIVKVKMYNISGLYAYIHMSVCVSVCARMFA